MAVESSEAEAELEAASRFLPRVHALPECTLVQGALRYYHYGLQNTNDHGWGCGFRTVQTILSWLQPERPPPTLQKLQRELSTRNLYAGERSWIGIQEAVVLLDVEHGAQMRIVHLEATTHARRAAACSSLADELVAHFERGGGPCMVGGGRDVYSKTVVGVSLAQPTSILILDPHYSGSPAARAAGARRHEQYEGGWIAWRVIDEVLRHDSFYNVGLPTRGSGMPAAPPPSSTASRGPCITGGSAGDWSSLIELIDASG